MPKISLDEEEEEDEDEQFEEDEPPAIHKKDAGRYQDRKKIIPQRNTQQTRNVQPEGSKRRYGVIPAQPMRIIDTEGQEVVGEGEFLTAQALTDIIERLERIENAIGSMTG